MRPRDARRTLAVAAALAVAAVLAGTGAASGPPVPPQIASVTVDSSARVVGGMRVAINGHIACTKGARFKLYVWTIERSRGALAKGSLPAKLPLKPTAAALAHARAISLCSG